MPTLEFSPERDRELLAEIPAAAGVFALYGPESGEPYVSRTTNLRRRLIRLLGLVGEGHLQPRRLNLRERVTRIDYWLVGSDFEAQMVLYRVLRQHFFLRYRDRLRLRPAPLVK